MKSKKLTLVTLASILALGACSSPPKPSQHTEDTFCKDSSAWLDQTVKSSNSYESLSKIKKKDWDDIMARNKVIFDKCSNSDWGYAIDKNHDLMWNINDQYDVISADREMQEEKRERQRIIAAHDKLFDEAAKKQGFKGYFNRHGLIGFTKSYLPKSMTPQGFDFAKGSEGKIMPARDYDAPFDPQVPPEEEVLSSFVVAQIIDDHDALVLSSYTDTAIILRNNSLFGRDFIIGSSLSDVIDYMGSKLPFVYVRFLGLHTYTAVNGYPWTAYQFEFIDFKEPRDKAKEAREAADRKAAQAMHDNFERIAGKTKTKESKK